MNNEERIKFYMGRYYNKNIKLKIKENYILNRNNLKVQSIMIFNYIHIMNQFQKNKVYTAKSGYIVPFIDILKELKKENVEYIFKNFLYVWGDVSYNHKLPVISKTRPIGNDYIILQKLDINRHWGYLNQVKHNDIKFNKKNNKIIWRGGTTGLRSNKGSRYILVSKYFDSNFADVGFSDVFNDKKQYIVYKKNKIKLKEQLKYKFIISCEGNDVASGLKWQLYSNSVCLMTKPLIESWAMESKLEPFVHYVPLEYDYSDLKQKYNWCLKNLNKCEEISKNATKYIEQFLNYDNENKIQNNIMKKYFENIEFEL